MLSTIRHIIPIRFTDPVNRAMPPRLEPNFELRDQQFHRVAQFGLLNVEPIWKAAAKT